MTTLTAKLQGMNEVKEREVPQTGYGRARYTIDYFMNGRPLKTNHDNVFMTVRDLAPGNK
jgi:hypothetical protein